MGCIRAFALVGRKMLDACVGHGCIVFDCVDIVYFLLLRGGSANWVRWRCCEWEMQKVCGWVAVSS